MKILSTITLLLFLVLLSVSAQQDYTGTLLSEKPAILKGKITAYTPQHGTLSISVAVKNWFNTTESTFRTELKPDGSFNLSIPVLHPTLVSVKLFSVKYTLPLLLEPGTETELIIPGESIARAGSILNYSDFLSQVTDIISLNGKTAPTSKDLIHYYSFHPQNNERDEKIYTEKANDSTPETYKAFCLEQLKKEHEQINGQQYTAKATTTLTRNASLKAAYFLLSYNALKKGDKTEASKLDNSYFSAITALFPKDQSYLLYNNGVELSKAFSRIDRYSAEGITFTTPEARTTYINQLIGANDNLLIDIAAYNTLFDSIERNQKPFTTDEVTKKAATLTTPFVANLLKEQNTALTALVTSNNNRGAVANEVPQVPANELFHAIIDKYKGKVILVDFWATWCPPCRVGIKDIKPLKEDFAGKDVVFLYITGETSPLDIWQRFIPNIRGEHYRLSKADWSAVCKEFGVSGIPFYMLVDKNGTILNEKSHHYPNEVLEERFIQMMK